MSSTELPPRYTLPKNHRLLTPGEFSPVFNRAAFKASHPQFLILAIGNTLDHPRLGLVVAKKNLRLAVGRNRFKRLVRESFRVKQHNLPPIDAIVLARRGIETLSNSDLQTILDQLWKRIAKQATVARQKGE